MNNKLKFIGYSLLILLGLFGNFMFWYGVITLFFPKSYQDGFIIALVVIHILMSVGLMVKLICDTVKPRKERG